MKQNELNGLIVLGLSALAIVYFKVNYREYMIPSDHPDYLVQHPLDHWTKHWVPTPVYDNIMNNAAGTDVFELLQYVKKMDYDSPHEYIMALLAVVHSNRRAEQEVHSLEIKGRLFGARSRLARTYADKGVRAEKEWASEEREWKLADAEREWEHDEMAWKGATKRYFKPGTQ